MLKTSKSFLRLYYSKHQRSYAEFSRKAFKIISAEDVNIDKNSFEANKETLKDKLLFSSYLESINASYGTRRNYAAEQAELNRQKYELRNKQSKVAIPLSLRYLSNPEGHLDNKNITEHEYESLENDKLVHFPFKMKTASDSVQWMADYENFDDSKLSTNPKPDLIKETDNHGSCSVQEDDNELEDIDYNRKLWRENYGNPDPSSEISNIPCGGCGALLHSKDTSFPGYLPSEIFNGRNNEELSGMVCQRCHFLKEYKVALNVSVNPEDYPKLLKRLKPLWALAILVVDVLDMPCSVWPDIREIIGDKRPLIVVGNKVDLLPRDSDGYLKNVTKCLEESIARNGITKANIKYISLISAKTGYGVEELINKLHNIWDNEGDVYLIGCTNVGKSTLFNTLLQSDYCRIKAVDLLQRSTVSQWPGTTLNLLKFPILRPASWRVYMRKTRLESERRAAMAEKRLRIHQGKDKEYSKYASLVGRVNRTFINPDNTKEIVGDPFSYTMKTGFVQSGPRMGLNENSKSYRQSKWCYDTPGVIHPDQILSLLTIEELMLTLPKDVIKPRTFYLEKGTSIFIAGLARLDFIESEKGVRFTVFSSSHLPITICKTENAEEIYSKFLGTELLRVPMGDENRLSHWPDLKKHSEEFSVVGEDWNCSCADIVMSSVGWVSVTAQSGNTCLVAAWTPEARGIHLRSPSLIREAVKMKGSRISGSPAYRVGDFYYGD